MSKTVDVFFSQKKKLVETNNIIVSTPIEQITSELFVKREDLACPPPGPPFGKVRGLYPVLQKLKEKGVEVVSYMDTSISMAGWGVSYFAKQLRMKAVIFYPQYKEFRHNQEEYIKKWHEFGAEVIPLDKPNRQQINWYRAKKILDQKYPYSELLPQGLPFEETIENVVDEIKKDYDKMIHFECVMVSVGSGIMLSGIVKGFESIGYRPEIYGIFVAPKNKENMKNKIYKHSGVVYDKLFLIDTEYEYTDREDMEIPFPCNPYYDAKAWKFTTEYLKFFKKPILFWNTGA